MLYDLVLDTNVILHADNAQEKRCDDAKRLINLLLQNTVILCVDEGFHEDQSRNKSLIAAEYLERFQSGSIGMVLVALLASQGRLSQVSRKVPKSVVRKVNQLIRKPRDRTFLRVSYNSVDKVLVSHDFQDFQLPKRRTIRKELLVQVLEALECCSKLE